MRPIVAVLLVLVLAGCGSNGATEWAGPPRPAADGTLDVRSFNDFLAGDGTEFARSPVAAVAEFLRLDESTAGSTSFTSTTPGESRSPARVVAVLDRLLDDSVRAQRYVVELELSDEDGWRLRSASWTQRCQAGRGHEQFLPEPCV